MYKGSVDSLDSTDVWRYRVYSQHNMDVWGICGQQNMNVWGSIRSTVWMYGDLYGAQYECMRICKEHTMNVLGICMKKSTDSHQTLDIKREWSAKQLSIYPQL